MPGFTQSQLSTLEAINPQKTQFVKRPNPVLAEFDRQSELPTTSTSQNILQAIEHNQFLQTKSLSSAISSISLNPAVESRLVSISNNIKDSSLSTNNLTVEFSKNIQGMSTLNRELVDEIRASATLTNKERDRNAKIRRKNLLSLDRSRVRQAQFERGIGREARFSNKLSATLRISATAALAFSIPSKRLLKPSMSIPEKQLALLSATHDVLRFSGQELISIRKKDSSNTFESSLINAGNRNIGQIVSDALQTTPVLAPLIEVGKFAAKIGKFALTPASTIFGLFKKEKDSKFSTGANLAIKAGLKLDHEKVAYQFLATQFPDISQEANSILNRQLGVQENIQGVLEDTLALFTKTQPQRRINQRDSESKVFDPFSGEFVTQKKVSELKDERFKRLVNTRRRERNVFSRVLGIGKKADAAAAKQAEGSTVNQVSQAHQRNLSKSDEAAIKSDLKLINSVELVNRIIGFTVAGPVGFSIGGALAALALKNIKADRPIEELNIKETIRPILSKFANLKSKLFKNKSQESSITNLPGSDQPKVTVQQNPINPNHDIPSPVKDALLLKAQSVNIETKQTSINSQAHQPKSTVATRLTLVKNKRKDKQDEELRLNEFQTLKDILFELKNGDDMSKKKEKTNFLFKAFGSVLGVFKTLVFKAVSIIGGFLGTLTGVTIGSLFTNVFKSGFGLITGGITAAFKSGFGLLKSIFTKFLPKIAAGLGIGVAAETAAGAGTAGALVAGKKLGFFGKAKHIVSKFAKNPKLAAAALTGLAATSLFASSDNPTVPDQGNGISNGSSSMGQSNPALQNSESITGNRTVDNVINSPVTRLGLDAAAITPVAIHAIKKRSITSNSQHVKVSNPSIDTSKIPGKPSKFLNKFGRIGKFAAKIAAKRAAVAGAVALVPGVGIAVDVILGPALALWSAYDIADFAYTELVKKSKTSNAQPSKIINNTSKGVSLLRPIAHTPASDIIRAPSSNFTPNGKFTTPFLAKATANTSLSGRVSDSSSARSGSIPPTANNKNIPLGIRNNNPGNIRATSIKWMGLASPSENNGFAVFKTPRYGIRALSKNLDSYSDRGLTTVQDIISTWAPPSENDTAAYINAVSSELGVRSTDELSFPKDKAKLISGIIRHENGIQPFSKSLINSVSNTFTVNNAKVLTSKAQTSVSNLISKLKESTGHGQSSLQSKIPNPSNGVGRSAKFNDSILTFDNRVKPISLAKPISNKAQALLQPNDPLNVSTFNKTLKDFTDSVDRLVAASRVDPNAARSESDIDRLASAIGVRFDSVIRSLPEMFANSVNSINSQASPSNESVKSHTSLDSMFDLMFSNNPDDIANSAGLFSGVLRI